MHVSLDVPACSCLSAYWDAVIIMNIFLSFFFFLTLTCFNRVIRLKYIEVSRRRIVSDNAERYLLAPISHRSICWMYTGLPMCVCGLLFSF